MNVEIKKSAKSVTLAITGRLDTTTAPALDAAIAENTSADSCLILDMSALEYISSAGLRVLLTAQKKLSAAGSMKLISVREEVMDVLEMTGFADILTIE